MGKTISYVFSLLIFFLLFAVEQVGAITLQPSTGLPGETDAEVHLFVLRNNQTPHVYWRSDIKPTKSSNIGRFAFYKVDSSDEDMVNAYYIYDCSTGQWLTYSLADKYYCTKGNQANCKNFVRLESDKTDGAYFFVNLNSSKGFYEITPALSSGKEATVANGNPSACYLNFHGGMDNFPDNTIGLWEHSGNKDSGSAWVLEEPSGGNEIEASVIPAPGDARISKVYSMHNGYGSGVAPLLFPSVSADGHFALEKVPDVENAYYIYDYSAMKWLYYTRQSDYSSPKKDFVSLEDNLKECFSITSIGNGYYEIRPYTESGEVAPVYLNYYLGVSLNKSNTIGYYSHDGSRDAGSRWTFTEVDPTPKTISEESDVNSYDKEGDLSLTLVRTLGSDWWNTFCVPFNISEENVASVFGADCQIREFTGVADDGKTLLFTSTDYIEAGKPYLVRPTATVTNPVFDFMNIEGVAPETVEYSGFKMVGIYGRTSLRKGGVDLFLGDGDRFYKPSDDSKLKGMRAYFQVPENTKASSLRAHIDGLTTAITDIEREDTVVQLHVFNVLGQNVGTSLDKLPRGIYIQNGRKIAVK